MAQSHPPSAVDDRDEIVEVGRGRSSPELESPRLQVVLDVDHTLVHAANPRGVQDQDLLKRSSGEKGKTLYDLYFSRLQHGLDADAVYRQLHPGAFRHRGVETKFHFKIRPQMFEAIKRMRKISDLHVNSMGKVPYVQAVLTALFGSLKTPDSIINGEIWAKTDDRVEKKDLGFMFDAKEGYRQILIVDDQPAVWLQPHNVIPIPPFFDGVGNQVVVSPTDMKHEADHLPLITVTQQIEFVHQAQQLNPKLSAVDALRSHRVNLFSVARPSPSRRPTWTHVVKILFIRSPLATRAAGEEGSDPIQHLCDFFILHGGSVATRPDATVTHIVSDSDDHCAAAFKQNAAEGKPQPGPTWMADCTQAITVSIQWLVDSILFAHRMDERCYHPSLIGQLLRMDSAAFAKRELDRAGFANKARDYLKLISKAHETHLRKFHMQRRKQTFDAGVAGAIAAVACALSNTTLFKLAILMGTVVSCEAMQSAPGVIHLGPSDWLENDSHLDDIHADTSDDSSLPPAKKRRVGDSVEKRWVVQSLPACSSLAGLMQPGDTVRVWVLAQPQHRVAGFSQPWVSRNWSKDAPQALLSEWRLHHCAPAFGVLVNRLPLPAGDARRTRQFNVPAGLGFSTGFVTYTCLREVSDAAIAAALLAVCATRVGGYRALQLLPPGVGSGTAMEVASVPLTSEVLVGGTLGVTHVGDWVNARQCSMPNTLFTGMRVVACNHLSVQDVPSYRALLRYYTSVQKAMTVLLRPGVPDRCPIPEPP